MLCRVKVLVGFKRDISPVDSQGNGVTRVIYLPFVRLHHMKRVLEEIECHQQQRWQQRQQAEEDKAFHSLFVHGQSIAVDDVGNRTGILGRYGMGDRQ